MLTESPYVAKRLQAGIPAWDILVRGVSVGTLTDLPMEDSPMATVGYYNDDVTFAAKTIYGVLDLVGQYLHAIDVLVEGWADGEAAVTEAEYYAEVIGPMKAAEDRAERMGWGDEDPIW